VAKIGSLTVILLTGSGKGEFRHTVNAGCPRPMGIAKPMGIAIANRQDTAVYQHNVMAVFTGKRVIFELTQLLEPASLTPCFIHQQP
jgi:hypothetical protein